MIEWIKITPETEFPKGYNILCRTEKDSHTVYLFDGRYKEFQKVTYYCDKCEKNFINIDFTHYAIINLPSE